MLTTKTTIKAQLDKHGDIKIDMQVDISDHKAREILDAIASTLNDTWTKGKTTITEKGESLLVRKGNGNLDQQELFPEGVVTPDEDIDTVV